MLKVFLVAALRTQMALGAFPGKVFHRKSKIIKTNHVMLKHIVFLCMCIHFCMKIVQIYMSPRI